MSAVGVSATAPAEIGRCSSGRLAVPRVPLYSEIGRYADDESALIFPRESSIIIIMIVTLICSLGLAANYPHTDRGQHDQCGAHRFGVGVRAPRPNLRAGARSP